MSKATILITVIIAMAPAIALASDEKTQGGGACIPQNPEDSDWNITSSIDTWAAGGGYAWCPLLRDNTTNTTGLDDLDIRVFNYGTGTTLTCTAYSLDEDGNVVDSAVQSTTTYGDQWLNWGTSINVSVQSGSYTVRCTLGQYDEISTMVWAEP